jgi:catechol 2,3-dioxygenase-like lactoylglutathione lyase family enzyme
MSIELNHTIVSARDPQASAQFLAGILGLEVDPPLAHFTPVTLANRVTLDYDHSRDSIQSCHYAFLASDEELDAAFARIQDAGIAFFADPACQKAGQIYTRDDGGRGVYFRDPDGHLMEILTRPAR